MSIDQIANGRMWTNDMSMNVWRPASSMEPSSATLDSSSIPDQLHLFPLPIPDNVEARPLTRDEKARIDMLGELQFFLATAPTRWNQADTLPMSNLSKFQLPNGEHVSCILWNGLYHITGTDIVRALAYRFEAFGRPIKHTKKWEEGVFSDLRNLKPGTDACLEEPKSPLLDFLFRNGCIRTQKKQKVFYWFSVPHDRLFLDALERDLKREKAGQEPTTAVAGEPARSFRYDPRRSLYEQFAGQNPGINQTLFSGSMHDYSSFSSSTSRPSPAVEIPQNGSSLQIPDYGGLRPDRHRHSPQPSASHFFSRTLFEGSPAYKRRRGRSRQGTSPSVIDENGIVQRRGSPMPESYTSDMRSVTTSPRLHPHVFRKVSGEHDLGRSSPALVKRERDSSSQLPDGPDGLNDDDRVYQCSFDFCRRKFKRLEHLKRHLRTHTQEKPFDCSKCARSFSRQDNLVQHLRTHEKAEEEEGYEVQEYRWATASPVGGGYPNHSNHRPFHNSISAPNMQMPPPSLPVVSRPSTVPPDWPSIAPPADLKIPYEDSPLAPSQMRRYRSATPSVITYNPVPMPPPPPTSWNGGYDYWIPTPSYDVGGLMPPPVGAGYGGEMIQLPYGVEAGGYDPPAGGA